MTTFISALSSLHLLFQIVIVVGGCSFDVVGLKEEGIIVCDWVSGEKNSADLFTKNLAGPVFDKHTSVFVGRDQYMKLQWGFVEEEWAKPNEKKPSWQLKKNGKTKARVPNINYGDNNFK
jgi:hypothetical protein